MTWTERYLAAVLRSIPEPKRTDVERELQSSIDDAIEERVAAGEDRSAAERSVLEGLGDPAQLAGAYTGQPTYLVGPELFPLYRKFVPRVIAVAVPIAAIVQMAVKLLGGGELDDAIGAGISGAIDVGIQIAFWATVTFVFLEWAGPARQARAEIVAASGRWTLERLPKVLTGRITVGEAAGEIVTVLITLGIFVFMARLSTIAASGAEVHLFAPEFTTVWLPILLAATALRGAVHLKAYALGRWTRWLAVYHALLQASFGVLVVVLALSGWILNPAFGEAIGWPGLADGRGPVMLTLAVGTTLATSWEILRIFLRARRAQGAAGLFDAAPRSA
jgi:HAAS domain-containing protein